MQQVKLVGLVKESARSKAIAYAKNVSDSVALDLMEQHELEEEFLRITNLRTNLLTKTNRNQNKARHQFAESHTALQTVTVDLRQLTFKLVSHLKQNPSVPANVKRVALRRTELEGTLADALDELADGGAVGGVDAVPESVRAVVDGDAAS